MNYINSIETILINSRVLFPLPLGSVVTTIRVRKVIWHSKNEDIRIIKIQRKRSKKGMLICR